MRPSSSLNWFSQPPLNIHSLDFYILRRVPLASQKSVNSVGNVFVNHPTTKAPELHNNIKRWRISSFINEF